MKVCIGARSIEGGVPSSKFQRKLVKAEEPTGAKETVRGAVSVQIMFVTSNVAQPVTEIPSDCSVAARRSRRRAAVRAGRGGGALVAAERRRHDKSTRAALREDSQAATMVEPPAPEPPGQGATRRARASRTIRAGPEPPRVKPRPMRLRLGMTFFTVTSTARSSSS